MNLRQRVIGHSAEGRPIRATTLGRGAATLIVIPGIHGDEPLGPRLAKRWLLTNAVRFHSGVRLVVVDAANPDGLRKRTKDNAGGVDLNRNFPSRNWGRLSKAGYDSGRRPASEPETRALISLIRKYAHASRPTRRSARASPRVYILTLHEPFGFVNYDGPARAWAEAIARVNRYAVEASVGYPTPGSLGTYFGVEQRIPVITLECAREPFAAAWRRHRPALDAALDFVAKREQP